MPSAAYRAMTWGLRSTAAAVTGRVAPHPYRSKSSWTAASRRSMRFGPTPYRAPMTSARRTRLRGPFPLAATVRGHYPPAAIVTGFMAFREARSGRRERGLRSLLSSACPVAVRVDPSRTPRTSLGSARTARTRGFRYPALGERSSGAPYAHARDVVGLLPQTDFSPLVLQGLAHGFHDAGEVSLRELRMDGQRQHLAGDAMGRRCCRITNPGITAEAVVVETRAGGSRRHTGFPSPGGAAAARSESRAPRWLDAR